MKPLRYIYLWLMAISHLMADTWERGLLNAMKKWVTCTLLNIGMEELLKKTLLFLSIV